MDLVSSRSNLDSAFVLLLESQAFVRSWEKLAALIDRLMQRFVLEDRQGSLSLNVFFSIVTSNANGNGNEMSER